MQVTKIAGKQARFFLSRMMFAGVSMIAIIHASEAQAGCGPAPTTGNDVICCT